MKTKNLEKIAGHLQHILTRLTRVESDESHSAAGERSRASLEALLDQLEDPKRMAFDTAWELADLLELEFLWVADDADLFLFLTHLTTDPVFGERLGTYLPKRSLDAVLASYAEGKFKDDHFRLEKRAEELRGENAQLRAMPEALERRIGNCALSQAE